MSSSIWQIFERGSAIDDFLLRRQTLCFLRSNNWTFALLKRGLRNALNVFSFYFDDHSARMATWPSTAVNRWFIENVKKLQVTNHSWKLTSIRLSPGRNPFLSAAKILFLEVERHISSHSMGTHVYQTTRSTKIIRSSMKHTKNHFVSQFEFLRAPKIVQKPERNETFNVSTNVYNLRSC